MGLLLILLLGPLALADSPFDKLGSEDLARGKRLFEAQCAVCHGINGSGGKGANLSVAKFKRAADDAALIQVVRNGIEDSEMPAAWWMSERESLQAAYYVRSLGRIAPSALPGDASAGKAIFGGKGGCGNCHIASGEGTALGPELTDVGARRSPAHLREAVLNPGKASPEGFLMIRVVGKDGKSTRGIRVNEDTFTLQIRDLGGRLHSFRKSETQGIYKEFGQTPMPSYEDKLSADEVDHLVAYLASLRGGN